MKFKELIANRKAKVAGVVTALAGSASAAINWTTTSATVTSAIALVGTIVSEIVNIIPDVMVLIILLAIAAFVGTFLKGIMGKIKGT